MTSCGLRRDERNSDVFGAIPSHSLQQVLMLNGGWLRRKEMQIRENKKVAFISFNLLMRASTREMVGPGTMVKRTPRKIQNKDTL